MGVFNKQIMHQFKKKTNFRKIKMYTDDRFMFDLSKQFIAIVTVIIKFYTHLDIGTNFDKGQNNISFYVMFVL